MPVAKVELPAGEGFKEWKAGLVKQLAREVASGRCRSRCRRRQNRSPIRQGKTMLT